MQPYELLRFLSLLTVSGLLSLTNHAHKPPPDPVNGAFAKYPGMSSTVLVANLHLVPITDLATLRALRASSRTRRSSRRDRRPAAIATAPSTGTWNKSSTRIHASCTHRVPSELVFREY